MPDDGGDEASEGDDPPPTGPQTELPARLKTVADLQQLYDAWNQLFFAGALLDAQIAIREIATTAFAAKTITGEGAALFGFTDTPAILVRQSFMDQSVTKVAATFLHEMTHVATGDRDSSHPPAFCREAQRVANEIVDPSLRASFIATMAGTPCAINA